MPTCDDDAAGEGAVEDRCASSAGPRWCGGARHLRPQHRIAGQHSAKGVTSRRVPAGVMPPHRVRCAAGVRLPMQRLLLCCRHLFMALTAVGTPPASLVNGLSNRSWKLTLCIALALPLRCSAELCSTLAGRLGLQSAAGSADRHIANARGFADSTCVSASPLKVKEDSCLLLIWLMSLYIYKP
jgi:hypothetical protein